MTVATYTTNMTDLMVGAGDKANATALGGGASGLNDETDYFIQGTGMISKNAFASAKKGMIYDCASDRASLVGTDGAFVIWTTHATPNSLDLQANGGIDMVVGSGTGNYKHYYVGGSDSIEFMGWVIAAVNPSETADEADTGTPTAVERYVGILFDLPTGGPTKGAPNALDAIRAGRCDLIYEFGTSADPDASFALAVADKGDVTDRLGLIQLVNGSYFLSGLHQYGSATNAVNFTDSNKTLFWRDHPGVTAPFNTVDIQNASSTVDITNISWKALGAKTPGTWTTTDNATVNKTTCNFIDWGNFTYDTNTTADGCTYLTCGKITTAGATVTNCSIQTSSATIAMDVANAVAAVTNTSFTSDGTGYAMEGFTTAGSYTLSGLTFTGYAASDGSTGNEAIHVTATTGTVTLNYSGAAPSVHTDGATIVKVNSVNFTLTNVVSGSTFTLDGEFTTDTPAGTYNGTGDSVIQFTGAIPASFATSGDVRLFNGTYYEKYAYTGVSGTQLTGVTPTLTQDFNSVTGLLPMVSPTTITVDPYTVGVQGSQAFQAMLANQATTRYIPLQFSDTTSTGFARRIQQIEE